MEILKQKKSLLRNKEEEKMKENLQKTSGITLVALVVTIIVRITR